MFLGIGLEITFLFRMEHDTLEYILKIKKMEKELFTIQTDRFTKVSGLTTENTVRKDSNSAFIQLI